MNETVTLSINGTSYTVAKGLSVLQAARSVGIHIPAFCWHKHLSVSGNCRMCLVEIKPGPPKPSIACATPVAEGMQVFTESEMARSARKTVLEFLLMNHPLDCPVCDEAYECKLQDYTYAYGAATSRIVPLHDEKRVFKREKRGKLFMEMNRCIDCTRCVRFLKEVAGEYEMERYERGHRLKIDSYKEAFESPFLLNAADLCPVGALEDAKFRFSARAWELTRTPSVCPSCSIGCNIYLDTKQGVIKRLLPRENDAVNACFMCDAGRWNYDFVHAPERLRAQVDGKEAAPEDALAAAIERLQAFVKAHGARALALWLSPWMPLEGLYLAKRLNDAAEFGLVGLRFGENTRPVVPVLSDVLPKTLVSDDKTPNSTGARLLGLAGGPAIAAELLVAIERGAVKGLVLFHDDWAALADLDAARARAALDKLELLITVGYSPAACHEQAGIVLPTRTFAESDGSFVSHHPRWQRLRAAVPSELPSEARLLAAFAAALGYDLGSGEDAAVRAELVKKEAAFRGLDPALADAGQPISAQA